MFEQPLKEVNILTHQKNGKVIRFFTVEIAPSGSDPTLDTNSFNPYNQLSHVFQDLNIN